MMRIFISMLLLIFSFSIAKGQQIAKKLTVIQSKEINYLLYEPLRIALNKTEKRPLLLFLHGGNESGNDIELVKKHGPPHLVNNGCQFPFYILSPQNQETTHFWNESLVISLLDSIIHTYPVDTSRIYLAGLSRGAYGAWRLAMQYPAKFAALIAISGAAPSPYAKWIGKMPVWVFHGKNDPVIPVSESKRIVEALRRNGNNAKLTLYYNTGHDAWTKTFDNPDVFKWLLEQHR
jgi:predicted peptidase